MFSRNDWAGMSQDQRLLSIQGLETQEALNQGRPSATVLKRDLGDSTHVAYSRYKNEIYINDKYFKSAHPDNAVNTWGHETKHANDHYNGKDLSAIPDPEIDFQGYWEHPQEIGCRNYGNQKLEQYNQNESKHHTGLYDNQNKGITAYRDKAAENQEGLQNSQNKGLDSFREKTSGNQEATSVSNQANTVASESSTGHNNDVDIAQSSGQSM